MQCFAAQRWAQRGEQQARHGPAPRPAVAAPAAARASMKLNMHCPFYVVWPVLLRHPDVTQLWELLRLPGIERHGEMRRERCAAHEHAPFPMPCFCCWGRPLSSLRKLLRASQP